MVRVRNVAQDKKPRKMSRSTETGSSATVTGSGATDDVSNDDVIDDVSNLASFRHIYPINCLYICSFEISRIYLNGF